MCAKLCRRPAPPVRVVPIRSGPGTRGYTGYQLVQEQQQHNHNNGNYESGAPATIMTDFDYGDYDAHDVNAGSLGTNHTEIPDVVDGRIQPLLHANTFSVGSSSSDSSGERTQSKSSLSGASGSHASTGASSGGSGGLARSATWSERAQDKLVVSMQSAANVSQI